MEKAIPHPVGSPYGGNEHGTFEGWKEGDVEGYDPGGNGLKGTEM